jgi:hypothetical protein
MPNKPPFPFACPHCGANYRVIRIEATAAVVPDREVSCLSCGGPLRGRDGACFLKYFVDDQPRKRKRGTTAGTLIPQPSAFVAARTEPY